MNKNLLKIKNKLKEDSWYRIAFLGDSITSTEWVYPNWRGIVEFVLKEKMEEVMGVWETPWWKIRCYNAGFNGVTTREMIDYVDEEVSMYKPDLVIFMDTYNDKYSEIEPDEHKNNLNKIFEKLFNLTEELVFTTSIPRFKEEANIENKAYMEIANEAIKKYGEKIQFVDMFSKYSEFDLKKFFTFISENGNKVSGIQPGEIDFGHPNQLGNAYIAKIMLKEIFNINFDPELYIKETLEGKKYPSY
jgi:lysophospholipase L1-like esterase